MNRWRVALAMAAVLFGTACSEEPTRGGPAQAGTVIVTLVSPNTEDGAIAFEVRGAWVDSALTTDGSRVVYTRRVNDTTLTGVVVGDLASGALVKLYIPDLAVATSYSARVLEVADRQDEVRDTLTGYILTVTP